MEKKIVLITGATDGIGKETAKALAKKNFKVIIHGRNEKKAKAVVDEIKKETPNAELDIVLADLLSFKEVKKMAEEVSAKYDHLDVLINNAGAVFSKERLLTKDGEERTFQLNVFSPFLLSQLLLPLVQKSKDGRIIIEASAAHSASRKPDFNDMKSEKKYGAQGNYCLSKLYAIWMARHFSKVLKEKGITNVTYNIAHPGASGTDFGQSVKKGFIVDMIYKLALRFTLTPAEGAASEIYLASSSDVQGVTGKYYSPKCIEDKVNERYYSKENEQKIWDYCMKVTKPWM